MEPAETVTVEEPTVACDGGTLGHPRVFLHIGSNGENEVRCPYCGRRFVLADGARAGTGH